MRETERQQIPICMSTEKNYWILVKDLFDGLMGSVVPIVERLRYNFMSMYESRCYITPTNC